MVRVKQLVAGLLCFAALVPLAAGQVAQDYEAQKQRALELYRQHDHVAALPVLEELVAARPDDAEVVDMLCFSILVNSAAVQDAEARRQQRLRARMWALRAKDLGAKSGMWEVVLMVPEDGSLPPFSDNPEVEKAMQAGEAAFAAGQFDKAIDKYLQALALNPNQYEAALYIGDVYYKRKEPEEAEPWFARAVLIDGNRETAHRYWGDMLLASGKEEKALEKFVDAIIAEPYNQMSYYGISNWARRKQVNLGHPKIESPNKTSSEEGKTVIAIDPSTLSKKDGSSAWLLYDAIRASWSTTLFKQKFPDEKVYRHTLSEEAAALSVVAASVRQQAKDGKVKKLDPALQALLEIDDQDLLEAYILFAHADEGISQDYVSYREKNREKLVRYWYDVVVKAKQ